MCFSHIRDSMFLYSIICFLFDSAPLDVFLMNFLFYLDRMLPIRIVVCKQGCDWFIVATSMQLNQVTFAVTWIS